MNNKFLPFFILIFSLVVLMACQPKSTHTIVLQGQTMGTTYTVKYISDGIDNLPEAPRIQAQIDDLLREVNRQMSTYQPDSEISQFNQMRQTQHAQTISADFAQVTNEAIELNRLTQGALDVTVGPLVNLWGFGPDKQLTYEPSNEEIARASQWVGIEKIILNPKNHTIAKTHPEVYLDLSSIAKGFGVDKVAQHLDKLGIHHYLVEIGGELRGKGYNEQHTPWRVGIEQPNWAQQGDTALIIPLQNKALATSGDYRIFRVDKNGNRQSHIINPLTKQPINHQLASISVVADTTMRADGLSTGLFVLGEKQALNLAEQHHLAVFLIIRTNNGYRTEMSSEFKKLISKEK